MALIPQWRDDLVTGEQVEGCPFCEERPRFRQFPGRKLVLLEHFCRMITFEDTAFPEDANMSLATWNGKIEAARQHFSARPAPNVAHARCT